MIIPKHIWWFLYAFLGTVLVSLLDFAAQWAGMSRQDLEVTTLGNFLVGTIITIIFIWFIFQRKNWARIVYTIFTLVAMPVAIVTIGKEVNGDLIGAISSTSQVILSLMSIAFIFTRQSREWFKASQQNAPADADTPPR